MNNEDYIWDWGWQPDDHLGQFLAQTPVAPKRMHKMDGGKYICRVDQNLLVLLHKLGLRGRPRGST